MTNSTPNPGDARDPDPRVSFAAERTLLAWIRTGLALMGLGFVVARFGLLVDEQQANLTGVLPEDVSASEWVGTAFVLLGVAVNILAAVRHHRTLRRLSRGQAPQVRAISLEVVLSGVLALFGLGLAAYLLWLR